MTQSPALPTRSSLRLKNFDLSQAGAYFVTLCTQNRECLFGEITNDRMVLNQLGQVLVSEWLRTAELRQEVELDAWVVMPNHFHAVVILAPTSGASSANSGSSQAESSSSPRGPGKRSLSALVAGFKAAVTKGINERRGTPGCSVWQRNYYEHIIRDDESLNRIREYIFNNPLQWSLDRENPANLGVPHPMRRPQNESLGGRLILKDTASP